MSNYTHISQHVFERERDEQKRNEKVDTNYELVLVFYADFIDAEICHEKHVKSYNCFKSLCCPYYQ